MRRIAFLASFVLALGLAAPVAASPVRCEITVSPSPGTTTDSYRISGTAFPAGSWDNLTDVHLSVGRVADGRLLPTMFLLLFPGGGGEFYVDYHVSYEGEEPAAPLEPGLYRIRAVANGHECIAVSTFWVTP